MDAHLVRPIIEGTIRTFEIQANIKVTYKKPFYRNEDNSPVFAIAGVIGLASPEIIGSISLYFPEKVFLYVMSEMLGEKCTEIDTDLRDGIAEMLNIIFGHAKGVLNERGYALQMAIPTIIYGKNVKADIKSNSPTIVFPFETPAGDFRLEINTEERL